MGDNTLLFHRMTGAEGLSEPFEFHLELLSEDPAIDPNAILGKAMSVSLTLENDDTRAFHGHVCRFGQGGARGRFYRYYATLRPWLWFLSRAYDCRIFQKQTVPEIIDAVISGRGFSDFELSLTGNYTAREYCVQYRETDLNFISRLMEEEGIYYFFRHEDNKHTVILTDSIDAHSTTPGYESVPFSEAAGVAGGRQECITSWTSTQCVQPGAVSLRDFDFEDPRKNLEVKSTDSYFHDHGSYEWYDYPGKYLQTASGEPIASCRLDEFGAQFERMSGESNAMGLAAGALFSLTGHPRAAMNAEYLLLETHFSIQSDGYESGGGGSGFQSSFTALHRDTPFRPQQKTPKPEMRGPQTAIVVGPRGEEIWTDQYGRVKVQFHWDRQGRKDENSSCWMRVSQPWAGKGWGAISIPRVGQEVIVDFLEGDPDQPIITGRVYNGEQTVPYSLPDNQTQTGMKSRSSAEGSQDNFNEIRMEDKRGEEEIYIHAEKNMNVVVENSATLKVGFDKKDPGDQTVDIYNHRTTTLEQGNDKLQLKQGNREVVLDMGNHTMSIKQGNQETKIDLGKSTLEAMQSIELKVGQNSIKIDQTGVTIKGMMINIEGTSMAELKSPMTTVKGDGMLTAKGGIIMIN